jgi:hypothetical protein
MLALHYSGKEMGRRGVEGGIKIREIKKDRGGGGNLLADLYLSLVLCSSSASETCRKLARCTASRTDEDWSS